MWTLTFDVAFVCLSGVHYTSTEIKQVHLSPLYFIQFHWICINIQRDRVREWEKKRENGKNACDSMFFINMNITLFICSSHWKLNSKWMNITHKFIAFDICFNAWITTEIGCRHWLKALRSIKCSRASTLMHNKYFNKLNAFNGQIKVDDICMYKIAFYMLSLVISCSFCLSYFFFLHIQPCG